LNELLGLVPNHRLVDVEVFKHLGSRTASFNDEAQQNVLSADVFVIGTPGGLIGQLNRCSSPICKSFVHVRNSLSLRIIRDSLQPEQDSGANENRDPRSPLAVASSGGILKSRS
jgi:hypothetical protein